MIGAINVAIARQSALPGEAMLFQDGEKLAAAIKRSL
jgi:hypothetical protein